MKTFESSDPARTLGDNEPSQVDCEADDSLEEWTIPEECLPAFSYRRIIE